MRRYLSLNILALVVYITYPMAPPWLAAQDGSVSGDVVPDHRPRLARARERRPATRSCPRVGNPVAAMPSLHAGIALVRRRCTASPGCGGGWRWLLLLYPLTMSFMLVYYAEHYVIDIVAGFAATGLVLMGCSAWERRRPAR